jgi:outer membrane protein assembly factor BamB
MDETPGGPPEDPKPHDEEQLPQEPHPHEGMPSGDEEHQRAGDEPQEDREHGGFGADEHGGGSLFPGFGDVDDEHDVGGPIHAGSEESEFSDFEEDPGEGEEPGEGAPIPAGSESAVPGDFDEQDVGGDDDEEHHTVEETALAGGLSEDTELHEIDDDAEVEYDYHSFDDADYESLEGEIHTVDELRQRRLEERAARRRAGRQRLIALVLAVAVIVIIIVLVTSGGGSKSPTRPLVVSPIGATASGRGFLEQGSPSALPGNIVIADRNNHRVLAITPEGQAVWEQNITSPSDAYPSASAKSIVVTEHGNAQLLVLSVTHQTATYHYGHPNVAAAGPNRLHDPSTGQFLPDGRIVIADKANCRVLIVRPPLHTPVATYGSANSCVHKPPTSFGYPDGAFPTTGGGLVVTESTPAWIDLLDKNGKLVNKFQVAGLLKPDAANQTPKGDFIATNYAHPGAVVEFDSSGKMIWSYGPTSGAGELNFPTLATVLSNGNVLVSDARNDRVIVIDPSTKEIVWQYGHTHKPGLGAGFLHTPDSAVAVPVPAS